MECLTGMLYGVFDRDVGLSVSQGWLSKCEEGHQERLLDKDAGRSVLQGYCIECL